MKHGNYGSGSEPQLTSLERIALSASQRRDWAQGQIDNYPEADRHNTCAYLRGFRDAMELLSAEMRSEQAAAENAKAAQRRVAVALKSHRARQRKKEIGQ